MRVSGPSATVVAEPVKGFGAACWRGLVTATAARRVWVLAAANMDEALAWGRKAAIACRAPVEVRQFH